MSEKIEFLEKHAILEFGSNFFKASKIDDICMVYLTMSEFHSSLQKVKETWNENNGKSRVKKYNLKRKW